MQMKSVLLADPSCDTRLQTCPFRQPPSAEKRPTDYSATTIKAVPSSRATPESCVRGETIVGLKSRLSWRSPPTPPTSGKAGKLPAYSTNSCLRVKGDSCPGLGEGCLARGRYWPDCRVELDPHVSCRAAPTSEYEPAVSAHEPADRPVRLSNQHAPSVAAVAVDARTEEETAQIHHDASSALPLDLNPLALPKHVAIIMDGNSRWSERRHLPSQAGHEAGVKALEEVVRLACRWGIQALTVFAFSTENWARPKVEVDFLLRLFELVLRKQVPQMLRENICVRFVGDTALLPHSLRELIHETHLRSEKNTGLKLSIAVSYSGRQDLVQACRALAQQVAEGTLQPADITEAAVEQELATSWMGHLASPDLLIRTSGEQRLSNFLLWQSAYSELYFSEACWPEFDEGHFRDALVSYQQRERRFGRRK